MLRENEGCTETLKLVMSSDCNTDLAAASKQTVLASAATPKLQKATSVFLKITAHASMSLCKCARMSRKGNSLTAGLQLSAAACKHAASTSSQHTRGTSGLMTTSQW